MIIIPAYNEERVSEVVRVAERFDEVVVVDDGSREKVSGGLRHLINMGKGCAMKTGVEYALSKGADKIVFIDGDLQHDPEQIPLFLKALDDYEVVLGFRSFNKKMPMVLRMGNYFLTKTCQLLFGVKVRDLLCGFRAFRASAYRDIEWLSNGYEVETEMIKNIGLKKKRFCEIPLNTTYQDKYKGTGVIDGLNIFMKMLTWRVGAWLS